MKMSGVFGKERLCLIVLTFRHMKKFITCFLFIFIGLSCTKETAPILCGCSPIEVPSLSLVIKSANDADLLDPAVKGAYLRDGIKLFYKEGDGTEKQVEFFIRPPFGYGNDGAKFNFHQIRFNLISKSQSPDGIYFPRLSAAAEPETLQIEMNNTTKQLDKVTINGVDNPVETSLPQAYGTIYSLVK